MTFNLPYLGRGFHIKTVMVTKQLTKKVKETTVVKDEQQKKATLTATTSISTTAPTSSLGHLDERTPVSTDNNNINKGEKARYGRGEEAVHTVTKVSSTQGESSSSSISSSTGGPPDTTAVRSVAQEESVAAINKKIERNRSRILRVVDDLFNFGALSGNPSISM